ncbi:hypothetical protein X801_08541 [Opisthorchis viverrini]|uniref:Uncharacterized protein n=1 Tax=Opisthorchis viverrini TaxID=6198 RepID=A0A1S8WMZ7_OPIVI|nr:hypothetical protein X801_08541 [Opisthorchis viverrini]
MLEDTRLSPDKVLIRLEENLNLLLFDLVDQKRTIDHFDLAVGEYRPTFFVCRHRNCGFYEDFQKERENWAIEKQKLKEEIEKLDARTAERKVYKEELTKLQNAFTSTSKDGDSEIRFRLGELSRELTMQRVNELALLRRYAGSQELEVVLRKTSGIVFRIIWPCARKMLSCMLKTLYIEIKIAEFGAAIDNIVK